MVLRTQRKPIREWNPGVPARLAELLDEALIDNPHLRFKTAAEFRQALQQAL